jgi:outer membrane protein OmpA-like peptidoglycan-associated protein
MRRVFALALLLGLGACADQGPRQTFLVFFEEWSAQIGPQAQGSIAASADYAKRHPNGAITVVGFADPTGSAQANIDISRLRAQVVTDALVANGVDPARITRQARGATSFEQSSLESRRVEIDVAPSP